VTVASILSAILGFIVTWCAVALVIRVIVGDELPDRIALPTLIVSSAAVALFVAARARRKRMSH
jgi:hypothetical protein